MIEGLIMMVVGTGLLLAKPAHHTPRDLLERRAVVGEQMRKATPIVAAEPELDELLGRLS